MSLRNSMRQVVSFFLATSMVVLSSSCNNSGNATPPSVCAVGLVSCSGVCTVTAADSNNCGACGNVCGVDTACFKGICTCTTGLTACGTACVNTITDVTNCGTCGNVCLSGSCVAGLCVAPASWHGMVTSSVTWPQAQQAYATWKTKYLLACGEDQFGVIQDPAANAVVSEGVSYGMLLAVAMSDQDTFNGLFNYYWTRAMSSSTGLMPWKYIGCATTPTQVGSATDADLDAAMALLQAEKLWPGNAYDSFATPLIAAILAYEITTCNGLYVLMAGDSWGPSYLGCDALTNPSYYATGYFHVFAKKNIAWTQIANDAYTLLGANSVSAPNNLFTDWANAHGTPVAGMSSIKYSYDACRTPWRIAIDYGWFQNASTKAALAKVASYVSSVGGPMSGNMSYSRITAFVGAFALSGLALDQVTFDAWIKSWIAGTVDNDYYNDTLGLLYMVTALGGFESTL